MADHAKPSGRESTADELRAELAVVREDLDTYRELWVRADDALTGIGALIEWWRRVPTP